ncbi:MAG: hypothetical protein HIU88_12740 [Acidobacteria bacterium]|nr:hypothetical protein [Acidobacteriota bacterium]
MSAEGVPAFEPYPVPTDPREAEPDPEAGRTMSLMSAFVLEDGRLWGECALPFQRADAEAIISRTGGARQMILRARGMSKTTDIGAVALALLLSEAPAQSRSYAYAVDQGQAALMHDAVLGLIERTGLARLVDVKATTVTVKATGATLSIEASDGASAYGLKPWLTIADELGMWPATENHRRLWGAIVSAVPKVPGSRLVAIGHAGPPSGLGAEVWNRAQASPHWRTVKTPGPSPWWTPQEIAATRADLTPSEWRRLIECEFAEGDDALTTAEDVEACIRVGDATLPPKSTRDYVASLDIGTRRDLSAFAIGHTESREAGRTVVIDKVLYWRPGKGIGNRVDLTEVEASVLRLCREYHVDRLRFDRMMAEQLIGNVMRAGVKVEEFVFSSAGAARLARSLHVALRDRAIELPDDEEIRSEALTVRMVETTPGMIKMSNPPGTHDDVLTAIGMVVADLVSQPEVGAGSIWSPAGYDRTTARARPLTDAGTPRASLMHPAYNRPIRGPLAAVYTAGRNQSEAERRAGFGLPVPGTANDPTRR